MAGVIKQLIESPQRSPAALCGSGEYALYTESVHSLSDHHTVRKVFLLETATGKTFQPPAEKIDSNFKWVEPSTTLIWQRRNGDLNELWTYRADDTHVQSRRVGSTGADAVLLHAVLLQDGDIGILLSQKETVSDQTSPHSTGKLFTRLPILTFDEGIGRHDFTLLYSRVPQHSDGSDLGEPVDVLAGSNLKWFPHSGAMPNISVPNCAISNSGIAFTATKKGSPQLGTFTCEAYFVPLPEQKQQHTVFTRPFHIPTETCTGWAAVPAFSADGQSLAFLREGSDQKVSIDRSIFVVTDLHGSRKCKALPLKDANGDTSSLYPEAIVWGNDSSSLYFPAIQLGRQRLFRAEIKYDGTVPAQIAQITNERGSVVGASFASLASSCVVTTSSFTTLNLFRKLDFADNRLVSIPGQTESIFSKTQVSEEWFESDGRQIRAFILRPSYFDESKKYPLALLIHGGPISTFGDIFSTRWSMAAFAEQGYIVVTPDFTGSAGLSREFRDSVFGSLGGKPYQDIEACMDFVARTIHYADVDRAVCLGGSYGGYMVLWIAGQPLASRFKALVSHASVMFGATTAYASDIPDLWQKVSRSGNEEPGDLCGIFDRWDPSRNAAKWKTPLMITHGERDNRCPIAISLAAFTQCQFRRIESKLLVFPDESHFILKPGNSYHWYSEVIAWIDRFAKA